MTEIVKLIRVNQWVKNFFIFVPPFFAEKLLDLSVIANVLPGFFGFCFMASAIYIINDYVDIEKDREHPVKRNRPLAAGKIKTTTAFIVCGLLFTAALSMAWYISNMLFGILIFYFVMNLAYSLRLKHVAIVDITLISFGFLLRVIAGGALAGVEVSKWLFLMTFLLSMILALAKRRDEFVVLEMKGSNRVSIRGYNLTFIDISMGFLATVTFICYIMYTISDDVVERLGADYIYISSFFVLIGLLRYLQLSFVYKKSGSPTRILYSDKIIKLSIVAWIVFFAVVLYWT